MSDIRALVMGAIIVLAAPLNPVLAAGRDVVRLRIDPNTPGPTIDRHLFGQFAEHLGHGIYEGVWVGRDSAIPNTRGIRNDVVAALKALHVPVVRWPGGCFADEYHWRKGIGPADERPTTLNPNWGGVLEPNRFGSHEFMDFAEQIGAEAYLSVNVGSGTPEEAADWLEYLTADKPTALEQERVRNGHPGSYRISYLGIGNESWGCGGTMSPEYYLSQLKIYSRYVRNYGPAAATMQRIAVGPDGADTRYTEAIMQAWQNRPYSWDIEGLSMHFYTVGKWPPSYKATNFGESDYTTLVQESLRMEDLIATQSAVMDKYDPQKKISLVVDEWGVWLASTPGTDPGFLEQQNSQRDAIIAALTLNTFVRHADRVRMANIAQMINVLQAMIFTDKERMLLTPTYYVYRMYVPFQDAQRVSVSFDAGSYAHDATTVPQLDAIAARAKDGRLWLALTNLDANHPLQVELAAGGVKRAVGEVLASPAVDSVNSFAAPTIVAPRPITSTSSDGRTSLRLPAHSVTVVALQE